MVMGLLTIFAVLGATFLLSANMDRKTNEALQARGMSEPIARGIVRQLVHKIGEDLDRQLYGAVDSSSFRHCIDYPDSGADADPWLSTCWNYGMTPLGHDAEGVIINFSKYPQIYRYPHVSDISGGGLCGRTDNLPGCSFLLADLDGMPTGRLETSDGENEAILFDTGVVNARGDRYYAAVQVLDTSGMFNLNTLGWNHTYFDVALDRYTPAHFTYNFSPGGIYQTAWGMLLDREYELREALGVNPENAAYKQQEDYLDLEPYHTPLSTFYHNFAKRITHPLTPHPLAGHKYRPLGPNDEMALRCLTEATRLGRTNEVNPTTYDAFYDDPQFSRRYWRRFTTYNASRIASHYTRYETPPLNQKIDLHVLNDANTAPDWGRMDAVYARIKRLCELAGDTDAARKAAQMTVNLLPRVLPPHPNSTTSNNGVHRQMTIWRFAPSGAPAVYAAENHPYITEAIATFKPETSTGAGDQKWFVAVELANPYLSKFRFGDGFAYKLGGAILSSTHSFSAFGDSRERDRKVFWNHNYGSDIEVLGSGGNGAGGDLQTTFGITFDRSLTGKTNNTYYGFRLNSSGFTFYGGNAIALTREGTVNDGGGTETLILDRVTPTQIGWDANSPDAYSGETPPKWDIQRDDRITRGRYSISAWKRANFTTLSPSITAANAAVNFDSGVMSPDVGGSAVYGVPCSACRCYRTMDTSLHHRCRSIGELSSLLTIGPSPSKPTTEAALALDDRVGRAQWSVESCGVNVNSGYPALPVVCLVGEFFDMLNDDAGQYNDAGRVYGRLNINTADEETLQWLPIFCLNNLGVETDLASCPWVFRYGKPTQPSRALTPQINVAVRRLADYITAYRDMRRPRATYREQYENYNAAQHSPILDANSQALPDADGDGYVDHRDYSNRAAATGIPGLRSDGKRGFLSSAEILIPLANFTEDYIGYNSSPTASEYGFLLRCDDYVRARDENFIAPANLLTVNSDTFSVLITVFASPQRFAGTGTLTVGPYNNDGNIYSEAKMSLGKNIDWGGEGALLFTNGQGKGTMLAQLDPAGSTSTFYFWAYPDDHTAMDMWDYYLAGGNAPAPYGHASPIPDGYDPRNGSDEYRILTKKWTYVAVIDRSRCAAPGQTPAVLMFSQVK
jgi:hypothetical protein